MEEIIALSVVVFGVGLLNVFCGLPAFAVGMWFSDDASIGILGGATLGMMIFVWMSVIFTAPSMPGLTIAPVVISGLAFALWAWAGTSFGALIVRMRRSR